MTRAFAPVAALLLSAGILLTGNGLQSTLLPIRAQFEAFSTFDIGVLGSAYFFGFALGCLFGPHVVRRVGHIRAFTALVSVTSTTALLHVLLLEPVVWWILRVMTGFCFAALYMIIESWINERATNQNRGLIFSIYTIITLTVIAAGQMMITLADITEFVLFALSSVLVSLAAVPVALTRSQAPAPLETVRIRIGHLARISPVGFAGCLAVGLTNGSFWALGPVFAQGAGMTTSGIALFMSAAVVAGAIGQWPLGYLSDRFDRRRVILASSLGAALAGLGMSIAVSRGAEGLLSFAILFGTFAFPLYSLSAAHMNDFVEPGGYVEAASGLLLTYAAGAVIGPIAASALMHKVGLVGLFSFTAAIHLAAFGFTIYRMIRRVRPPEEERVKFIDSLRAAQTVSTLEQVPDSHDALSGEATTAAPADGERAEPRSDMD